MSTQRQHKRESCVVVPATVPPTTAGPIEVVASFSSRLPPPRSPPPVPPPPQPAGAPPAAAHISVNVMQRYSIRSKSKGCRLLSLPMMTLSQNTTRPRKENRSEVDQQAFRWCALQEHENKLTADASSFDANVFDPVFAVPDPPRRRDELGALGAVQCLGPASLATNRETGSSSASIARARQRTTAWIARDAQMG